MPFSSTLRVLRRGARTAFRRAGITRPATVRAATTRAATTRAATTRAAITLAAIIAAGVAPSGLTAQTARLLQLDPQDVADTPLAADRGVAGLRQRLLELRTTASVLHTTAHPDDEQAGLLTFLSRGTGARTALLTLNRGEAGANAVGPELFDALGLLRTEELLLAGRYYGVDDQYFTAAADYGYSKTMQEAARSWDTTAVLADMVRVIRQNQPVVVVSRWYGGERDGHGHHQLAGFLTPLAVAAAADSTRFPEQLRGPPPRGERLTTWRVRRLVRANLRPDDRADVTLDAGRHDPWLGESYQSLGADGLSRQRSQTAGRRSFGESSAPQRLQQLTGPPVGDAGDLFSGIDTSLPSVFALAGEPVTANVATRLREADEAAASALRSLQPDEPWRVVPLLLTGLRAIRAVAATAGDGAPRAEQLLRVKERQFERAIVAALAIRVSALAGQAGGDGRLAVPGDTVLVQLTVSQGAPTTAPGRASIERVDLAVPTGWPAPASETPRTALVVGTPWRGTVRVVVPATADANRPPVVRASIAENRYAWRGDTADHSARGGDPLRARVTINVNGEPITVERVVRFRLSAEPDGISFPRLVVVPPVSVRVLPAVGVVTDTGAVRERVTVDVTGYGARPVDASVGLELPSGERVAPQSVRVSPGARQSVSFDLTLPRELDSLVVRAVARVDGREWRDDVSIIRHRELEPAYLYSAPVARIRRIAVTFARGQKVGYIMGVGDLVPDAITQLGAEVTLLDPATVAAGDYSRWTTLVVGTRAYAVRPELTGATPAILQYARSGGNVVVLYQTQEFRPESMAPFRASLPNDAEETTEEDAAVRLLAPTHRLLSAPNAIDTRDFDGWIEQRGSKFLTNLSAEYTPLVETRDAGQAPQQGIWVSARVGAGRWTYCALALHRQLPYAVSGAFRILANLLTPAP